MEVKVTGYVYVMMLCIVRLYVLQAATVYCTGFVTIFNVAFYLHNQCCIC